MRKLFSIIILAAIISIGCSCTFANPTQPPARPSNERIKKEFEQRLNLTDKQKEKAKAIHQKGKEQIKPIYAQIEEKRKEIEAVKLSRMAIRAQEERIAEIQAQIGELEKKAREIRKVNSQEFEKILTKRQKNELAKMKAEGRAKFEKNHPSRPPFQGLGTPGFLMPRPLFPPVQPPAELIKK